MRNKTVATYDEAARKDYLKGFHKRKVERKKEAEARQKQMALEERKQERAEVSFWKKGGEGTV